MSKKSIIICLAVTVIFIAAVAAALSILYSGQEEQQSSFYDSRDCGLLAAVPSDAVFVLKTAGLSDCISMLAPESTMGALIGTRTREGNFTAFLDSLTVKGIDSDMPAVISGHLIGDITPLLILDAGKAGAPASSSATAISAVAESAGLFASYLDVSECTRNDCYLKKRSILIISPSDILIQSSERHLKRSISILDSEGVSEAMGKLAGRNWLILPSANFGKIVSENILYSRRSSANFLAEFAECIAVAITECDEGALSFSGYPSSGSNPQKFANVFRDVTPSVSKASELLPSYTVFAATLPLADANDYHIEYLQFAETRALARTLEEQKKKLRRSNGTDPVTWAQSLDLKEIAVAMFKVGSDYEKVLLLRPGEDNKSVIFKGLSDEEIKNYSGGVLPYPYAGFTSALFGKLFSAGDESSFIYKKGWILVGSQKAMEEYASGRALEYPLSDYMADAGVENEFLRKDLYFGAYYSVGESPDWADSLFTKSPAASVKKSAQEVAYEPVFLTVNESKSGLNIRGDIRRTDITKSKAPVFERDTVVNVPKGPFKVKNSGTGKMNLFYQQDNLYLCLQEDGGKGLWGVPFSSPICGTAQTVDYFANGKLQILFGAGTKIHLIDRLGRFVNPFPVDLGKEILIGPDVYDFSGLRRYNIMVLHKDNTIEMYNLQGKKPADWKGIAPKETIMGLPERLEIGGKTYWVVRTSLQTLIYGFYGGEPLTVNSGEKMIRRDSEVKPTGNGSVTVTCYDGKTHEIKL